MNGQQDISNKINTLSRKLEVLQASHQDIGRQIASITTDLRNLRLSSGNRSKDSPHGDKNLTLESCRNLLGSRVYIVNAKINEPNVGEIVKVGKLYVTIKLDNNQLKRRIPKNLRLVEHE